MQFIFSIESDNDFQLQIKQPSAGYYTNIQMMMVTDGTQTSPNLSMFGTDLPLDGTNLITELSADEIALQGNYLKNGVHLLTMESGSDPEVSSGQKNTQTRHYGKKKIWVKHDSNLHVMGRNYTTGNYLLILADFIPNEGSIFRKTYETATIDVDGTDQFVPGEVANTYFVAPFRMENAMVRLTGSITGAGHVGRLLVNKFNGGRRVIVDSNTQPTETEAVGDIYQRTYGVGERAGDIGHVTLDADYSERFDKVIPVGTIDKGDVVALGYDIITTGTDPSMSIIWDLECIVAQKTKHTGGYFIQGNSIINQNEEGMSA